MTMNRIILIVCAALILSVTSSYAQSLTPTGEYTAHLYRVTLLRSAPGGMATLIEEARAYKSERSNDVVIMRHSQGDHWDLMIVEPAGEIPHSRENWNVEYQDDLLASSDWSWSQIEQASGGTGLFHIEMFRAATGMAPSLLREREMENEYLEATGRAGNAIFVTQFGSDFDSFTIGFYPDMITFATDPDLSDETYHKAATDAGFVSRSDIGFFLRQFIVGHQDTLASQVR